MTNDEFGSEDVTRYRVGLFDFIIIIHLNQASRSIKIKYKLQQNTINKRIQHNSNINKIYARLEDAVNPNF